MFMEKQMFIKIIVWVRDIFVGTVQASNGGEMVALGCLGVLHPAVLKNFGITNPCSVLELDLEPFL